MTSFKYIILLILVANCANIRTKDRMRSLNEFKKTVSKEVFKNFPVKKREIESCKSITILNPYSLDISNYSGIFIVKEYDDIEFQEKCRLLDQKKVFKSSVNDTCNQFISSDKLEFNDNCYSKKHPVPALNDRFNNIKLYTDSSCDYLVLESKNGVYVKQEVLKEIESSNMKRNNDLKNGENGFSNGVILNYNSKSIIYWIIIW